MVRIPVRAGIDLAAVIADVASSFSKGCSGNTVAKVCVSSQSHPTYFQGRQSFQRQGWSLAGLHHAGQEVSLVSFHDAAALVG